MQKCFERRTVFVQYQEGYSASFEYNLVNLLVDVNIFIGHL